MDLKTKTNLIIRMHRSDPNRPVSDYLRKVWTSLYLCDSVTLSTSEWMYSSFRDTITFRDPYFLFAHRFPSLIKAKTKPYESYKRAVIKWNTEEFWYFNRLKWESFAEETGAGSEIKDVGRTINRMMSGICDEEVYTAFNSAFGIK